MLTQQSRQLQFSFVLYNENTLIYHNICLRKIRRKTRELFLK